MNTLTTEELDKEITKYMIRSCIINKLYNYQYRCSDFITEANNLCYIEDRIKDRVYSEILSDNNWIYLFNLSELNKIDKMTDYIFNEFMVVSNSKRRNQTPMRAFIEKSRYGYLDEILSHYMSVL